MKNIDKILNSKTIFSIELKNTNDKILNFAIFITAILAIPGIVALYSRFKTIGLDFLYLFQLILLVLTILLYMVRNKIDFKTKFISFLSISIVLMFSFTLSVGAIGYWSIDVIFISLITSMFFKKKYAFILLIILTIFVSFVGFLYFEKYLVLKFDVLAYINHYSIWLTMIVTFFFISIITIFTISLQRDFFISSIKQLTQAKEKSQKSELIFNNIFNSSIDGMVITNFEGLILDANISFLNFLKISKDDLINKTVKDFVLDEYYLAVLERTTSVSKNESLPLLEILIKNSINEIIPVELNTILIDYNNEKAIFSVIRDITERKKIEQNILSTIIKTEEKERSRFAKELHDGVGPLLSATKIYAKSLPKAVDENERNYTIKKLNETVNEAIISAEEIANNISPHVLRNFGLKRAIEAFYNKINKISSLIFDFHSNLEMRIDENIETTLYRVVVELIHNTMKYANANLITIILVVDERNISLNYYDDGIGFDLDKTLVKSTGMGLSNIFNRIKSLSGKIVMQSENDKGLEVNIKIAL